MGQRYAEKANREPSGRITKFVIMLYLCFRVSSLQCKFFLIAVRAEIVSHPQANVTKEEGSNLTLFCNATGNPTPIILWTKDGSPINNNSRIRFSIHNRLLTVSNVNRTDSGHYRCVANNSLGNDISNVSTVDIQCKFSYHYCILFSYQGMSCVLIISVDCQQLSHFFLQFTLHFCFRCSQLFCLTNMAFE